MDNTDNSNAHHNAHHSDLPIPRSWPTKWVGAPIRAIAGLTLDQLWVVVAMALILFRPLIVPISPHDFWWHMATGRLIAQTGTMPTVDSFSYTQAGEPFYNQGWLAQLLLYGLHSLGNIPLILVVQAAVIGVSYWLVLSLCIKRSNGAIRASVVLLLLGVMPISFDNWLVRPQSYAFPLFMGFLTILTLWRWGINRWLWLLPLLMIIWVNVHGSFVLGGALIALTFVGVLLDKLFSPFLRSAAATAPPAPPLHDTVSLRWLFVWGVITAAAMFLNPRGVGVLGYVFELLNTSSVTNLVTEWAAPTIRTGDGVRFFLFLIITTLILTYSRRAPNIADPPPSFIATVIAPAAAHHQRAGCGDAWVASCRWAAVGEADAWVATRGWVAHHPRHARSGGGGAAGGTIFRAASASLPRDAVWQLYDVGCARTTRLYRHAH